MRRLASSSPTINSDDRPTLELSFARNVGRSSENPLGAIFALAQPRGEHVPALTAPVVPSLVEMQRARPWIAVGRTVSAGVSGDPVEAAWTAGEFERAIALMHAADAEGQTPEPRVDDATGRMIRLHLRALDTGAVDEAAIDALAHDLPCDAAVVRLEAANRRGEPSAAHVVAALAAARADPWCNVRLLRSGLRRLAVLDGIAPAAAASMLDAFVAGRFAGYTCEVDRVQVASPAAQPSRSSDSSRPTLS